MTADGRGSFRRPVANCLAAAGVILALSVAPSAAVSADEIEMDRLAGQTRIDTAVAISQRAFGAATTVYLARSEENADALAAGPGTDGPVLLVPRCGEPPAAVLGEIDRLGAQTVVALGGESAVCDELLLAAAGDRTHARLAGGTRFDTAVAIAQARFPDGAERVFLANAFDAPDGVVGGVLTRGPILLVPPTGEAPEAVIREVRRLAPELVVALGGQAAISDGVLRDVAGGRGVDRIAGATRTETSVAVSSHEFGPGSEVGRHASSVYLARRDVFADAVAGGALSDGPILLVPSCGAVPSSVRAEVERLRPRQVVALGGSGAVCRAMLEAAAGVTSPDPRTEPEFIFGDEVPRATREQVRAELERSMAYIQELSGDRVDDFVVYVYDDPEALVDRYIEFFDIRPEEHDWVRQMWRNPAATAGRDFMFVLQRAHLPPRVMTHEYVHVIQWQNPPEGIPWSDDTPLPIGPAWLVEGIAEYLGWLQVIEDTPALTWEEVRPRLVDDARRSAASLRDIETGNGFRAAGEGHSYSLSTLAAEQLAERVGLGQLLNKYSVMAEVHSWEEAFNATFGLTVDEWYEVFEDPR